MKTGTPTAIIVGICGVVALVAFAGGWWIGRVSVPSRDAEIAELRELFKAEELGRLKTEAEVWILREQLKPPGLSDDAKGILKRMVDGKSGRLNVGISIVSVTGVWSSDRKDPRDFARWKAAVDELSRNGLVEFQFETSAYRVTKAGYDYALSL